MDRRTDIHSYIQTADRQTDTDTHTHKQTDRHTHTQKYRQTDGQVDRQADRQTNRETGRLTDLQAVSQPVSMNSESADKCRILWQKLSEVQGECMRGLKQ